NGGARRRSSHGAIGALEEVSMQPYTLLWLTLSKAEAGAGSHYLTDAAGLQYMMYGGAGQFSESSYTAAVPASTASGGTMSMYLGDAFDGYGIIFVDS